MKLSNILPLIVLIQHFGTLWNLSESLYQLKSELKYHSKNNGQAQGHVNGALSTVSRSSHGARVPSLRGTGYYSRVDHSLVSGHIRGVDWQRNRRHGVSHDRRRGRWRRRWREVIIVAHVRGATPWSAVDHCMPLVRESCVLYIAYIFGIGLVANKVQTALLVQIQNFLATAFLDEQLHVKTLVPASRTCHRLEVC